VNPGVFSKLAERCRRLPLFPLPGVVFLPHSVVPLHVFEARYRDLITDCLDNNLLIGIPALRPGWESDYDGAPPIQPIAGVGRIVEHHRFPDGRYNVAVRGMGRVRIDRELSGEELSGETSYRIARATLLVDQIPGGPGGLKRHLSQIRIMLLQIVSLNPSLQGKLETLINNPGPEMVDALGHLVIQDTRQRQAYIEQDRLDLRAELVLAGLAGVISRGNDSPAEA
jgi:Lon protease-like protein